jgi:hypothetical protein
MDRKQRIAAESASPEAAEEITRVSQLGRAEMESWLNAHGSKIKDHKTPSDALGFIIATVNSEHSDAENL